MGRSLGMAIQDEIRRVSALRDIYQELPDGVGAFGAALMKVAIAQAEEALAEGEVFAIMQAYEELKGFTG